MKQQVNKAYQELFVEKPRYFILMGGRGAGRSTVASQYAMSKLTSDEYFRCAIMRYILSDIRNSIYREITDRASENEVIDSLSINDSLMTIKYGINSINAVGFKKSSSDQKSKLKSLANYNCVIIEEADEIPEDDFMQLDDSLRTLKGDITIIFLLNPPAKDHWIVERFLKLSPSGQPGFFDYELKSDLKDALLIKTDYNDNRKNIAEASVIQYEKYKETKPNHYYNIVKGLIPETVIGRIYNNWKIIDEIPHEARLVRRGQDYGYSIDPSVIIDVYYYNGGYILDEQLYQKGMSNRSLAEFKLSLPDPETLVVADGAEPKSIDEEKDYGVNIIAAIKGPGSVNQGIQFVQAQKISLTSRSKKTKKAYENYAWTVSKKDGSIINVPDDRNHEWSNPMDAARYALTSLEPPVNEQKKAELVAKRNQRRSEVQRNYGL